MEDRDAARYDVSRRSSILYPPSSNTGGKLAPPCTRSTNVSCLRIVLTGGPGGGKTTLMDELRTENRYTQCWILVPEAAPLLFRAGFGANKLNFQRAVVHLQMTLEEVCAEMAAPDQTLICHRGTLDALAYWLRNGWDEAAFFAWTRMSREDHFRRYHGVVHLQTAAIGAESYYHRWPEAHRPETIEQAAEIDRLCACAWNQHPRYSLIDNSRRDWSSKAQVAHDTLAAWLA
jgi:predicted ATPase